MRRTRFVSILATVPVTVLAFAAGLAFAESAPKPTGKAGDLAIQDGSTVKMEYTLTDKDGKLLDTNKGQDPLTYTHGQGQIIPGLEKALMGLHPGDQKHVVIPPEEAYGPIKPEAVVEIPKERIPADSQKVGAHLMARNKEGPPIPITVKEIKEKTIVLDANHPLAGMTLTFDIKILGIEAPQKK